MDTCVYIYIDMCVCKFVDLYVCERVVVSPNAKLIRRFSQDHPTTFHGFTGIRELMKILRTIISIGKENDEGNL